MDWNVIVTVEQQGYKLARAFLHEFGHVGKTDYMNVLVMKVDDIAGFLQDMRTCYEMGTIAMKHISRIMPVTEHFIYQTVSEFEEKASEVVRQWLGDLAGRHFYVRLHRRGFRGRLSSQEEERFLDIFILQQLEQQGMAQAKVDFSEAERVIAIETLGQQAGMSIWTRDQLEQYPFLKLNQVPK